METLLPRVKQEITCSWGDIFNSAVELMVLSWSKNTPQSIWAPALHNLGARTDMLKTLSGLWAGSSPTEIEKMVPSKTLVSGDRRQVLSQKDSYAIPNPVKSVLVGSPVSRATL